MEVVRAALQFGVDAARRFELETAGPGAGDIRAVDAVAHEEIAGPAGLLGGLRDRLAALLPAAQMLRRAVIGLQSGKGEMRASAICRARPSAGSPGSTPQRVPPMLTST